MSTKRVVSGLILFGALLSTLSARAPYVGVADASAAPKECHQSCSDRHDECSKRARDDGDRKGCEKDRGDCDRDCDKH